LGDGGMVLTNSRAIYEQVELLRRHGGKVKYHHSTLGLNSRLDELQAAILRVKLKYIEHWNAQRRERAYHYNRLLAGVRAIQRPLERTDQGLCSPLSASLSAQSAGQQRAGQSTQSVYHQYTVRVDDRDALMSAMQAKGIECFPYYPVPLHLQEVHAGLGYAAGTLPHAESASRHCLSLPMFPELTFDQQQRVVQELCPVVSLAS
jgi:dTDP-4-amino-4,6-dideoxygalactose transaminase